VASTARQTPRDDPDAAIVRALVEAEGGYVSGTDLGRRLGLSRPAVWGRLKRLREEGFEVEAKRNRGYRLMAEPSAAHPTLLRVCLDQAGSRVPVRYYPALDSTNTEAERLLGAGEAPPFAVAASCQTQGRGRLGRSWFSASADNLYLSVLFQPEAQPRRLQHFTLWAGILICRELRERVGDARLSIKWPNDVLCEGRKVAGMLTEARMDVDRIRSLIFGIGLNVNSNPASYPRDIRSGATSLYAITGREQPLNRLTAGIVRAVERAYRESVENAGPNSLLEAWKPLDALAGRAVAARSFQREIRGRARGIDEEGALRIERADGAIETVHAGDVTLSRREGGA